MGLVITKKFLSSSSLNFTRKLLPVIAGTPIDGYYEVESANETLRYVLQFHDCFWHGCPNCYQINRERKLMSGASHEDTIDTNEFS